MTLGLMLLLEGDATKVVEHLICRLKGCVNFGKRLRRCLSPLWGGAVAQVLTGVAYLVVLLKVLGKDKQRSSGTKVGRTTPS